MRAKVNITLTVRSSVYLVLHKPLLIYVGRFAQVVSKCICYYSPSLKKIVREFEINVWVILITTPLKICSQIHSIMIGDKKLSCFEALILIIPEKNHQLFSWIVDVPYQ